MYSDHNINHAAPLAFWASLGRAEYRPSTPADPSGGFPARRLPPVFRGRGAYFPILPRLTDCPVGSTARVAFDARRRIAMNLFTIIGVIVVVIFVAGYFGYHLH
jgi:hypothetical protein